MASDGSVTIKITAQDRELKDVLKSIDVLKNRLKELSAISPFENISKGASSALNAITGINDSLGDINRSLHDTTASASDTAGALNDINGDNLYDVSSGAHDAETGLHNASTGAFDLSSAVSDVNGDGLYDVSEGAYDASSALSDAADASFDAMGALNDIDGDGLYDVSSGAHDASSALSDTASASHDTASSLNDIDGANLHDVSTGASDASQGLTDVASSARQASQGTDTLSVSIKSFLSGAVAINLVSKGFDVLQNSIDGAINRFDTLNTYPRTMEALGYSTEQVDRSFRRLDEGIQGLPTTLDDITRNTQRIALTVGNLDVATDTALALNNAFLASGASSAEASRGTEQYIQMLRSGKVDMMSWRTLTETMVVGLDKAAEAFGYTGKTAQQDFYAALRDGTITFDEFNQKMIELNETQGGFAELAQTNSQTLRTAMQNITTAVVRGVTSVMQKLDELSVAVTGYNFAENINRLQGVVNTAFSAIGTAIETVTPIVILTADAFRLLYNAIEPLTPVILSVAAALAAMRVANQIASYFNKLQATTMGLVKAYQYAELTAGKFNTSMVAGGAVAKGLATIVRVATGAISAKAAAMGVASKAVVAFKAAVTALTGPIGWIVAGIGAFVGGLTLLWRTLGKASPEMQALTSDIESQTSATSQLNDQITSSTDAYNDRLSEIEANSNSIRGLIDDTVALSEKEVQSAADKAILKDNIESLNESIDGLNLAYDEETGKLNASSEAMKNRLDIIEQENAASEGQQRLLEINKERSLVEEQLAENSAKLNEAQQMLEESGFSLFGRNKELKESVTELEEQQASLQTNMTELDAQYETTTAKTEEAMRRQTEAIRTHVEEHGWSYDQLSEKQQSAVDTMAGHLEQMVANSQDAFNRINDQSSVSAEEMIANLEHNAEMTRQWGEDRAALMEIASQKGNEGFLMWLEGLGPDSAAELAEVANMSDEQLDRFIELMNEAPDTATDSFNTSLGEGMDEAAGIIEEKAQVLPDSMQEQLSDEKFAEMGRNVGIGLEQGITESSSGAEDASRTMAENVDEAAASALGIHSPSTIFKGHGENVVQGLILGIQGRAPEVVQIIRKLGQDMTVAMEMAIQQMSNLSNVSFNGFTQNIQQNLSQARVTVQTETSRMVQVVDERLTEMNNTAKTGFTQLGKISNVSFKQISTNVNREMTQVSNIMTRQTRAINQTTTTGYRQMSQTIQQNTTQQVNTIRQSQTQVDNTVRRSINSQKSMVRSGYSAMVSNIRSSMNSAVSTVRSSMNQAVSIMRNTASQARSAGYNMGIGFRNGLASTRGGILSTARSIANAATSTIRSALRIHSPSRVMMEIGAYTGEGMALGMQGTLKDVKRVADELAMSAIPKVNIGRTFGNLGVAGAGASSVQNNQQYSLNVNNNGETGWTREQYERLFREFTWYMQQEKGALDV